MSDFRVDDESGDRKYFTMVPNYILNHSSAIDQALYLQIKKHAGEHGTCFASGRTLRKKLGIGRHAFDKSLKYLLEHEWIYYKGGQMVETTGGAQYLKVYGIKDLWKKNIDHYEQGVAKSAPLSKVCPKQHKGVAKSAQGVARTAPNKNHQEEPINKSFSKKQEMPNILKRMS